LVFCLHGSIYGFFSWHGSIHIIIVILRVQTFRHFASMGLHYQPHSLKKLYHSAVTYCIYIKFFNISYYCHKHHNTESVQDITSPHNTVPHCPNRFKIKRMYLSRRIERRLTKMQWLCWCFSFMSCFLCYLEKNCHLLQYRQSCLFLEILSILSNKLKILTRCGCTRLYLVLDIVNVITIQVESLNRQYCFNWF
jgi:hypothetical protein